MGTRGLIGFYRTNKKGEKQLAAAYNHMDSYPSGLGRTTLLALKDISDAQIEATAKRLVLVQEDRKPTKAQMAIVQKHLGDSVTDVPLRAKTKLEWYGVLRDVQGEWAPWFEGLPYCIDYGGFIYSRMCEWAYVVNVEDKTLEVYSNSHKPLGVGRYNEVDSDGTDDPDVGGMLVMRIPLQAIRQMDEAQIEALLQRMETIDGARNAWLEWPLKALADKPLPRAVSTLRAQTDWFDSGAGYEERIVVEGMYCSTELRFPQGFVVESPLDVSPSVAAGSALGTALQRAAASKGIEGLKALDALTVALALYGSKATYAELLLWAPVAARLARAGVTGTSLAPLMRLCAEMGDVADQAVERLRKQLEAEGLTTAAWRWMARHDTDDVTAWPETFLLCQDYVSGTGSKSWSASTKLLNELSVVMPNETIPGAIVPALHRAVRRSDLSAIVANDRQRRNLALAIRALARAVKVDPSVTSDSDELKADVSDTMDFVRRTEASLADGCTWGSIGRLSQAWHVEQALAELKKSDATWENRTGVTFHLGYMVVELSSAAALMDEGREMHNCVRSYTDVCVEGRSRIFSIRRDGQRVATLEICLGGPGVWTVSQLRAKFNQRVADTTLQRVAQLVAQGYAAAAFREHPEAA
jgi:hypothetical protein